MSKYRLRCGAFGILLIVGLVWVSVTTPGAPLGCVPAAPLGWSHYPTQVQRVLEEYCHS